MLLFSTKPDLIWATGRQYLQYLEDPGFSRVDHQRRAEAVIGGMDAFTLSAAAIGAGTDIAAVIRTDESINCGRRCETTSIRTINFTPPRNELNATRPTLALGFCLCLAGIRFDVQCVVLRLFVTASG